MHPTLDDGYTLLGITLLMSHLACALGGVVVALTWWPGGALRGRSFLRRKPYKTNQITR